MTMMTGREALMELLRNQGVEYIFGIPGSTEIMFMDALEKHSEMKYILGLHEVVVAGMAEGYARVSGKPGVLNLHTGTGLSAAVPMLLNASAGGVPLVVTAGQQDKRLLLKDPHLAGDLVGTSRLFAKWYTEVSYVEEIPVVVQRAFKMAMQPPTGPIFISLPENVMNEKIDFEYIPDKPPFTRFRPDQDAINQAAELLIDTKIPVILVETGVARDGALSEAVKLAELIGARVYETWMADVNFPVQHPQYFGDINLADPKAKELLESADVLMWVGCPQITTLSHQPVPIMAKRTKMIQLDNNPWEIAKNFPVTVGIQGNIKASLGELINILEKNMPASARELAKIRVNEITAEKEAITEARNKQDEAERDNVPISISRLMRELRDVIRPGTVIVDDCWSSSATLRRTLHLTEPGGYHRARRGGSIGWGLPGSLGAKLATPDRPVVAVSGDGSAMWSVQTLWTAAHYNIPVTFVIIANAVYRMVKLNWQRKLGGELNERHAGTDLDGPIIDFCKLAESMGVRGDRVEQPDDLGRTLKAALDSDEPRLIEVKV
ncbi:thiamine pyrophosphate-binding protein [Chloroflexota bacterium]